MHSQYALYSVKRIRLFVEEVRELNNFLLYTSWNCQTEQQMLTVNTSIQQQKKNTNALGIPSYNSGTIGEVCIRFWTKQSIFFHGVPLILVDEQTCSVIAQQNQLVLAFPSKILYLWVLVQVLAF